MREIKFRAWEKHLKEIIPVHDIDFEKKMINVDSAWRLFDEIDLMQYTGLKDKNGKEIYEGDITKDTYGNIDIISWIEEVGGYSTVPVEIYPTTDFLTLYEEMALDGFLKNNTPSKFLEVIGNIYENPELLEPEK